MSSEFAGNIKEIRAIEDAIRVTEKYTEGIGTMGHRHPIQGTEFPSKLFRKYYEVYPYVDVNWDMPAGVALDLLWGDVRCVDVVFKYDYRVNRAWITLKDGDHAINELTKMIPGFGEAVEVVRAVVA